MNADTLRHATIVRPRGAMGTDAGSEVVVADDGPGFDASVADDPNTTLANIWQRLDMMCGGRMDIGPREGGGTVVKVTVPRQE